MWPKNYIFWLNGDIQYIKCISLSIWIKKICIYLKQNVFFFHILPNDILQTMLILKDMENNIVNVGYAICVQKDFNLT